MPWTHHVCGWDWYRIKGDQRQRMQLCLWTGQSSKPEQKKQENYPEKTDLQRQRAQPIHPVFCAKPVHTGACTCVYTHTHIIMYPFWHMTIYFPLSNERQAEGMAHILHNFKSQTFFCTCIKLENQLTPQHHLPEALLHISGPSGTPGGHYIPCGKLFFLPTKLPLAYSRQKYTVNPQVWAKAPSLRGYT